MTFIYIYLYDTGCILPIAFALILSDETQLPYD